MTTMAYNATPHGKLGASPHYAMFGCELVLPGWQRVVDAGGREHKLTALTRVRMESAVRAQLRTFEEGRLEQTEAPNVKVGDWVRWKLSEDEANHHYGSATITSTVKLQPKWSLPGKVVAMNANGTRVTILPLGRSREQQRDVAITQVQILPTEIPASLATLVMKNIQAETPRIPRKYLNLPPETPKKVPLTKIVEEAAAARNADEMARLL